MNKDVDKDNTKLYYQLESKRKKEIGLYERGRKKCNIKRSKKRIKF